MNRRDLMLAILAASGGQAYTPVQIQKAAFLVVENLGGALISEGPSFNFSAYDYGPFDRDVYVVADELRELGLADICNASGGRWKTYAPTNEGVRAGSEILQTMAGSDRDYIQRVSVWVRRLSFAALVKSIYEAYPQMRENSIFAGQAEAAQQADQAHQAGMQGAAQDHATNLQDSAQAASADMAQADQSKPAAG